MFYQNFDDNITAKYGVLCYKTGPFKSFAVPVILGHGMKFKSYISAWELGTTCFQKMTEEEYEQVDKAWSKSNGSDGHGMIIHGCGWWSHPNPIVPTVLPIPVLNWRPSILPPWHCDWTRKPQYHCFTTPRSLANDSSGHHPNFDCYL